MVGSVLAQAISADRPGFTNTASTVPAGMIQVESGYQFNRLVSDKEHSLGQFLLRASPVECFELRLGLIDYRLLRGGGMDENGMSDLGLGLKVNILDRMLDPGLENIKISAIIETTVPSGSDIYRSRHLQPTGWLFGDFTFTSGWTLSPFAAWTLASGVAQYSKLSGGLSVTYALTERVSYFIEYYGIATEGLLEPDTNNMDTGFTWIPRDNLQLDIHGGTTLKSPYPNYFAGVGLSLMFDLGG